MWESLEMAKLLQEFVLFTQCVYCARFVVIHAIDPLLSEFCFCTAGQIRAKSVLAIEVIMVEAR